MDEGTRPRRHRSMALRDLLLISLAGLVVFWLGTVTDAFKRVREWISSRYPGQYDEILAPIGLVALVLLVFSIIRWRDVRRQIRARNAAEHRYRTLVEGMPVVTYVAGTPHEATAPLRYVAPGIRELLGYSQEEWIADPDIWKKRLHPEDLDDVAAEADRAHDSVAPFSMEYRMVAKDGRIVWVRDEAVVVERGRRGQWNVWQGVLMDITERKEAEERFLVAETRYRSLVETIPAITYVDLADELSTTVYVSPQIETMLGYTPKHWREDTTLWMRAVHPSDLNRVVEASVRHNQTGEPYDQEYRIRTADDRWLWVRDQATIVRSEDGRTLVSQGVMFDVTERKLAEEALRESEQREREAAEHMRNLDEMKNTFLEAVSHELRSPLTSILGVAVTLEHQDFPEAERRDLLDRLAANARKLDRLLRDLLDIDRLSRGIMTPQYHAIDLGALVRRTVENFDVPASRTVRLDETSVTVQADAPKVERIVENLLSNAIRHTPPNVSVWVQVRTEDGGVLLIVEDDGAGVPRHLQKAIFEPFRQGPTASPYSPGTGIGLSLVAMFAELHGGKAWVEEREGGGASFRVFLPSMQPYSDGKVEEAGSPPPLDAASAG
ncbi:MAG TPA: PAS domain-containing protein [Actinomycetota bacterium]|nr:PAS domain-containing protein [Actinomycetota bacterium]